MGSVLMYAYSAAGVAGLVSGLALLAFGGAAEAGDQILRGATPVWVVEMPANAPEQSSDPDASGLRVLLLDMQHRSENDHRSNYLRTRSMPLSPQGLALVGSVGLMWSPQVQDITVHHVSIIRDGETIDVLATQAFETIRREENLDQAMLDGRLTALLQPAGLRVGDILDVAYTVTTRDPLLAGRIESKVDLNLPLVVDQARFRASWPTSEPVKLQSMQDWTPLPVRRANGYSTVEVRREAAQPVIVPVDVPGRFRHVNMVELSDYQDWSEIATLLRPLYDRARRIEADSPLHAEIERLRALSDDPAVQAAAALRLVQDQVRYVALLMGEGALTPATADETWSRRFGDCKGKTALLLALLDGLGIEADAAAVSLFNGDGLNERLPAIGAFDHVVVRTVVNDGVYWMDGTAAGDRSLADLGAPPMFWALPLTATPIGLEALRPDPKTQPDTEVTITMDATAGMHAPAAIRGTMLVRGDGAAGLAGQLGLVPASQRDQFMRANWAATVGDATITEVGSAYDTDANLLTLTMVGTITLNWPNDGLVIPGSTYSAVSTEPREDGPFKTAPYALIHPTYALQTATLRLPEGGRGFRVTGGVFDRTELGHQMSRSVKLDGDTVTVQIAMRSLVPEITAAEADAIRPVADARPLDRPRVLATSDYEMTDADVAALDASEPTTESGWLDRALTLSRLKDYSGAVEAAGKAVELAPQSSAAWANRGVYRFWTGDVEGATSDLDKAVDIDPSERIAMNGNALIAMSQERYQDAVVELSRALRQVPNDTFALNMRATAYLGLKQPERALRDLDAILATRPDNLNAQTMRVGTLLELDRGDEADSAMTALVEANPGNTDLLMQQAAVKLEVDQAAEAADILQRVIATSPDNILSPQLLRIRALLDLNQLDAAASEMAVVREAHAGTAYVLNNLCWEAALNGVLLEQALKDCDAAIALQPGDAGLIDSRGRVLLQMGDYSEALAAYEAALTSVPELAPSLYGRGLAKIALGSVSEGEADKAAALAINADVIQSFKAYPQTGAEAGN